MMSKLCLNLVLTTIVLVSTSNSYGIIFLFSILQFFIFIPPTGLVFYFGYSSIIHRPISNKQILFYRIFQGVLCVFWVVFSFLDGIQFNGWVKIGKLSKGNAGAKFC